MENREPRKIMNRGQLVDHQPILVGTVTSGDHPIQWEVFDEMRDWRDWVREHDVDEYDLNAIHELYVYELAYADSFRYKPR